MKGADEYYDLFNGKSQQIGRLFLQFHTHARGKCFEIYLLPKGIEIKGNVISGRDNVEIYGMTGGQRGWTETYGWLHTGKWQDDFNLIVKQKEKTKDENSAMQKEEMKKRELTKKDNIDKLLSSY